MQPNPGGNLTDAADATANARMSSASTTAIVPVWEVLTEFEGNMYDVAASIETQTLEGIECDPDLFHELVDEYVHSFKSFCFVGAPLFAQHSTLL